MSREVIRASVMCVRSLYGASDHVTAAQCSCPNAKAARDDMEMSGRGYVPTKLYLQKQAAGSIGPRAILHLLTPELDIRTGYAVKTGNRRSL